jgi:hypothetical protein
MYRHPCRPCHDLYSVVMAEKRDMQVETSNRDKILVAEDPLLGIVRRKGK